jgi:uncharacterized Zn finger protein
MTDIVCEKCGHAVTVKVVARLRTPTKNTYTCSNCGYTRTWDAHPKAHITVRPRDEA